MQKVFYWSHELFITVQPRQLPLPAGKLHLVTEDLDLSEGPVNGPAAAAVVAVGVDLDDQRHPLHSLLGGEVCAQTVHTDKDLGRKNKTDDRISVWRAVTCNKQ